MVNNRNAAWTFIFSLLPGAGQMYLGAMRKGIVLMVFFFFWIMIQKVFIGQKGYSLPHYLLPHRSSPKSPATTPQGSTLDH